jgi:hypothetical protein
VTLINTSFLPGTGLAAFRFKTNLSLYCAAIMTGELLLIAFLLKEISILMQMDIKINNIFLPVPFLACPLFALFGF